PRPRAPPDPVRWRPCRGRAVSRSVFVVAGVEVGDDHEVGFGHRAVHVDVGDDHERQQQWWRKVRGEGDGDPEKAYVHTGDVHRHLTVHAERGQIQAHPSTGVLEPQFTVVHIGRAHGEPDVALHPLVRGALHHTVVAGTRHGEAVRGQTGGAGRAVEAAVVLVDRDLGQTSLFFCCLAGQDGFEEFVLVLADPVLTDPELAGLGIALVGVLVLLVGVLAVLVVLLGLVLAVLGFGVRVLGGVGFFGVVTGFFGRILLALLLLVIGK